MVCFTFVMQIICTIFFDKNVRKTGSIYVTHRLVTNNFELPNSKKYLGKAD